MNQATVVFDGGGNLAVVLSLHCKLTLYLFAFCLKGEAVAITFDDVAPQRKANGNDHKENPPLDEPAADDGFIVREQPIPPRGTDGGKIGIEDHATCYLFFVNGMDGNGQKVACKGHFVEKDRRRKESHQRCCEMAAQKSIAQSEKAEEATDGIAD